MSDTLESLQLKKGTATELQAVVSTMKALAAASVGQYETAVTALKDYNNTVQLGIQAWLMQQNGYAMPVAGNAFKKKVVHVIIFGTDQGLVGSFNDTLAVFVKQSITALQGAKEIHAVGERIFYRLGDVGLPVATLFTVPGSVAVITRLIEQMLLKLAQGQQWYTSELYIFYNSPSAGNGYEPVMQRLLPLDGQWLQQFARRTWPTNNLPGITGDETLTLSALLREYIFVSLFKACAESLASENSSRLQAMQRAEKNIGEMLDDINLLYQRVRQNAIDEELFDIIAGFEALKRSGNLQRGPF